VTRTGSRALGLTSRTTHYLDLISGRKPGALASLERAGLRALSWPYGLAIGLRNRLFDAGWKRVAQAAVPVVSVGNLTLGGTGKTPCVEYVARHYRQSELRVAILSRGYGAGEGPNDESLLLEENLPDVPHLQGRNRVALANIAVEELESEMLVLDDGFQHRRLGRVLDIVLIDATQPWGFGRLFPRGMLRESPRSLRRAHAAVLSRCDVVSQEARERLKTEIGRLAPAISVFETIHQPLAWRNSEGLEMPLDQLRGRPAFAFCGIGNPEALRQTLSGLGLAVEQFRSFPDHHAYRRRDIEYLEYWAESLPEGGVVLTTQKDLVKIRLTRLAGRELWALRIGFHFLEKESAFHHLLDRIVTK
jgi:tetraacyldisaccharide 4'-kinase